MPACAVSVSYERYIQNAFTQFKYNSLNFVSRIKIPIIKLNCDRIYKGKSLRFPIYPI